MVRARLNNRYVLVRGVVSTLMVLAGEVPLSATVSMGWGGLLVSTGASAYPTLQDFSLMSVFGRGPMHGVCGIWWRIL